MGRVGSGQDVQPADALHRRQDWSHSAHCTDPGSAKNPSWHSARGATAAHSESWTSNDLMYVQGWGHTSNEQVRLGAGGGMQIELSNQSTIGHAALDHGSCAPMHCLLPSMKPPMQLLHVPSSAQAPLTQPGAQAARKKCPVSFVHHQCDRRVPCLWQDCIGNPWQSSPG